MKPLKPPKKLMNELREGKDPINEDWESYMEILEKDKKPCHNAPIQARGLFKK